MGPRGTAPPPTEPQQKKAKAAAAVRPDAEAQERKELLVRLAAVLTVMHDRAAAEQISEAAVADCNAEQGGDGSVSVWFRLRALLNKRIF